MKQMIYIGASDIASLTLRAPGKAEILYMGYDGSYAATFDTDADASYDDYELAFDAECWMWIYDDDGIVVDISAPEIKVYRKDERIVIHAPKAQKITVYTEDEAEEFI